jgi:hypothetical protein
MNKGDVKKVRAALPALPLYGPEDLCDVKGM